MKTTPCCACCTSQCESSGAGGACHAVPCERTSAGFMRSAAGFVRSAACRACTPAACLCRGPPCMRLVRVCAGSLGHGSGRREQGRCRRWICTCGSAVRICGSAVRMRAASGCKSTRPLCTCPARSCIRSGARYALIGRASDGAPGRADRIGEQRSLHGGANPPKTRLARRKSWCFARR